jgi:hypothetical protein
MTDFSGRLVSYGLALETTRGTAVAPQFWARWETADFEDEGKSIMNASAVDVLDKYSGSEVVEQTGGGSLAGKITDHTFGLILFSAFGGYSKALAAGETTVYTHTFTESQINASPSLTITRTDPNVQTQYTMAMLNGLDIELKAGDYVRHTSSFMSQPGASTTGITALPIVENEFIAKNATVTFNGGIAVPCNSFKVMYSKDVMNYFTIGKNNPDNIFAQSVEIKGEMVLRYTDDTYKTLRFGNTPQAVVLNVTNSAVTIGNSTHPSLVITMPVCYIEEWKVDQALDGMVQQTVSFNAIYNVATQTAITVALTNTHTQYNPAGIS